MASRLVLEEFEAVAPGIVCEKAPSAGDGSILDDLGAAGKQDLAQFVEVGDDEGGMGFAGGAEIGLDADVELLSAAFEPAAPART